MRKEIETITISNSKMKAFTRCQKMYYYKYVLNLQGKRKKETLERGSLVHACLEQYYLNDYNVKAMLPPLKDYQRKLRKMFEEEAALYQQIPHEVAQILRGYHRYWGDKQRFEILEIGGEPVIEKAFEIPITDHVILGITLDLAIEDHMGIWVFDTKTAKVLPSDEFRLTDTQSCLYEWGLEHELAKARRKKKVETKGVIWNYVRTKVPTVPALLQSGELSRRSNIDTDRYTYLKAIKDNGLDPGAYRDFLKTLPDSKNFYHRIKCPRNPKMIREVLNNAIVVGETIYELACRNNPTHYTRGLSFMCERQCEFRQLCTAEMLGHDVDFTIKTHYEPRKEDKYANKTEEEA